MTSVSSSNPGGLPKPASSATAAANHIAGTELDYSDPADFERVARGRIAGPDPVTIFHDVFGHHVWNTQDWDFLTGDAPDTVHPGLWRNGRLNHTHGLYEVTEHVYQVRGYDISNITFIEGETGWIVIDPLTTAETARAALALVEDNLGARPVHAVIYTHSHGDHFGGVKGVISPDDVASGRVPVIAPDEFLEAAIFENVIAGNAMVRRAQYMFGGLLPRGPQGQVDSGLGKTIPFGSIGLIAPTKLIDRTGEEMVVDGVRIVFQHTPDTEAPAEMNFFFPDLHALCMAENCTCVMHNLYTPRGAQVRDALAWSKYIDEAMELFADDAEVVFATHNWPRWGNECLKGYLAAQRDMYRYLHDQTMRLANHGYTPIEIAEQLEMPESLRTEFADRGYYGTVNHNAKAVYQRYLGWFDGNPANLHPLPPEESATRYVEYMGGADAVLARARESFEAGDYRWVAQVVNHVVFAEPNNAQARSLQADALEQLGYQAESGPWRNFYLTGAQELRHGHLDLPVGGLASNPEIISAMTVDMIFDLFGVRLNGPDAQGRSIALGWHFEDTGEDWALFLENSALHYQPRAEPAADVQIRLARPALDAIVAGTGTVAGLAEAGELHVEGDLAALTDLLELLDEFRPSFAIVTP